MEKLYAILQNLNLCNSKQIHAIQCNSIYRDMWRDLIWGKRLTLALRGKRDVFKINDDDDDDDDEMTRFFPVEVFLGVKTQSRYKETKINFKSNQITIDCNTIMQKKQTSIDNLHKKDQKK